MSDERDRDEALDELAEFSNEHGLPPCGYVVDGKPCGCSEVAE